ncbi:MAG: hypothetical protein N2C14_25750, partial [Planctomycetales bacterium]
QKSREIYDLRKASLVDAQGKLDEMRRQKQQMGVEIAKLEAQLEHLRHVETASANPVDDSKLSQTKSLLDDIEARIAHKMKVSELEQGNGQIQLDEEVKAVNAKERVANYFNDSDEGGNLIAFDADDTSTK